MDLSKSSFFSFSINTAVYRVALKVCITSAQIESDLTLWMLGIGLAICGSRVTVSLTALYLLNGPNGVLLGFCGALELRYPPLIFTFQTRQTPSSQLLIHITSQFSLDHIAYL